MRVITTDRPNNGFSTQSFNMPDGVDNVVFSDTVPAQSYAAQTSADTCTVYRSANWYSVNIIRTPSSNSNG